jgi:hypothetical protein
LLRGFTVHTKRLAYLLSFATLSQLLACGTTTPATEASRSIDGVLLFSDAEGGQAGYLQDSELNADGAQLKGGWYTYDDVLDCPMSDHPREGTIQPTMGTTYVMTKYAEAGVMPFPAETEAPNEWGIRFWGQDYEKWGAGIGIGLNNPSGMLQPYNLAAPGFTGLRFWAKAAAAMPLLVKFQDKYSEGAAPTPACCYLDKAVCGDNSCGVSELQGCFAAPNKTIELTTEWKLYVIPFADLVRPDWGSYVDGMAHAETLVLAETYQLQFEVGVGAPFDVFIDNVGFTLGGAAPAPTGSAGAAQ